MYELQYTKPSNTTSAIAEFDKSQDGKYLAGGMTLIPTLKARLATSDVLIDLKDSNLSGISVTSTNVVIGSMTRHCDVASSVDIKKSIPSFFKYLTQIVFMYTFILKPPNNCKNSEQKQYLVTQKLKQNFINYKLKISILKF